MFGRKFGEGKWSGANGQGEMSGGEFPQRISRSIVWGHTGGGVISGSHAGLQVFVSTLIYATLVNTQIHTHTDTAFDPLHY